MKSPCISSIDTYHVRQLLVSSNSRNVNSNMQNISILSKQMFNVSYISSDDDDGDDNDKESKITLFPFFPFVVS